MFSQYQRPHLRLMLGFILLVLRGLIYALALPSVPLFAVRSVGRGSTLCYALRHPGLGLFCYDLAAVHRATRSARPGSPAAVSRPRRRYYQVHGLLHGLMLAMLGGAAPYRLADRLSLLPRGP